MKSLSILFYFCFLFLSLPQKEDGLVYRSPILIDGSDFHAFNLYKIEWASGGGTKLPVITGDDKSIERIKLSLVRDFRLVTETAHHASIAQMKTDQAFRSLLIQAHTGDVLMFEVKLRQVKDPMFYQIVVASYETNLKRK